MLFWEVEAVSDWLRSWLGRIQLIHILFVCIQNHFFSLHSIIVFQIMKAVTWVLWKYSFQQIRTVHKKMFILYRILYVSPIGWFSDRLFSWKTPFLSVKVLWVHPNSLYSQCFSVLFFRLLTLKKFFLICDISVIQCDVFVIHGLLRWDR